jgi:hypothetical protein
MCVCVPGLFCSQQGYEVSSADAVVSPAAGLLSTTLAVLTGSPISLDLSCQQWLIELAGNIFSGVLFFYQKFGFTYMWVFVTNSACIICIE